MVLLCYCYNDNENVPSPKCPHESRNPGTQILQSPQFRSLKASVLNFRLGIYMANLECGRLQKGGLGLGAYKAQDLWLIGFHAEFGVWALQAQHP